MREEAGGVGGGFLGSWWDEKRFFGTLVGREGIFWGPGRFGRAFLGSWQVGKSIFEILEDWDELFQDQ